MESTFIYLIMGIFAGGLIGVLAFLVISKANKPKEGEDKSMLLMQDQLKEIRATLDTKLGESNKVMQTQFGESAKIIRDVTERLVKLDETNKQVVGFADQLQSLQDILKNPKQRGVLGEYYLETVLKNVFPPNRYQMQYKIGKSDEGKDLVVDAVIFLEKDKILPIDSKFSLENYNRIINEKDPVEKEKLEKLFKQDLKNRIDETAKYIKPSENTMDFAFMFIPSEGVYYDLLVNKVGAVKTSSVDLIEYAFQKKKVIIVSPTSFMAYLQTVLQGLRALKIEESAKEIRKRVEDLGRHLGNYDQFMSSLGSSIGTTVNHYNKASKEFKKIDKDVLRIAGESAGVEPPTLDRPELE